MAISGSCLCGAVQFEIVKADGPSEICHCTRCRKKSGATSLEMINVRTEHYVLICGADSIRTYKAPVLNRPPAYSSHFCARCGSPVPPASPIGEVLEIPCGLFDDDPGVVPDKHIFVDFMPSWHLIQDSLPQLSFRDLIKHRFDRDLPKNFKIKDHDGAERTV